MKVLTVAHAYPPEAVGGTERYAQASARGLAARGHELEVFSGSLEWRPSFAVETGATDGIPVTRVHRHDLYFDHWDKISAPRVAAAYEELLDRFRPDVVHLHHWIRLSFDLVRRAAARGIPALVHLHDLFPSCPRVFRIKGDDQACELPMGREACLDCVPRWEFQGDEEIAASIELYARHVGSELDAAAGAVAPTAAHADFLAACMGRAAGDIEVLPHPDLREHPWVGRTASSPAGRLRLLYFSHLNPIKGAHVLLEALRSLGPEAGVELDLFGAFATPEYEARLRALAEGLAVRFHGAYEGDQPAGTEADVVAIPSLARESHSFWLDEALATGLPLLVTGVGALAERAGDRALLVPRGETAAWADAIRRLRDEPELRARLAAGAGQGASAPEAHFEALERRLQQALDHGVRTRPRLARPDELQPDWDRREWAFRELLRSQGWERLLGEAQARIRELEGPEGGR